MASKYDGLKDYLSATDVDVVLSLEEIEEIIGCALPASAWQRCFWANATNPTHRAQRHAWGDVGYQAALRKDFVVFTRMRDA